MSRQYHTSHAGICGVAGLPYAGAFEASRDERYFFLLGNQASGVCSAPSILAHEVGHNFGARHENATTTDARGYITVGGYNTIMTAYIEDGEQHDFSNPGIYCPSTSSDACGVEDSYDAAELLEGDTHAITAYGSLGTDMQIAASVAPLARAATYSGSPSVTYLAAMHNAAGSTATGCGVELPGHNAHFDFEVYGSGNTNAEFSISSSSTTNLLLTYRPQSTGLTAQPLEFEFYCDNRRSAAIVPGVNTGFITTSSTSIPDIFAAAPAQNFVIDTVGGGAALAAFATTNVGASGTVSVSIVEPNGFAEIGSSVDLPVTLKLCETNPSTGACLSSFSTGPISVSYSGGPDNHTFAIAMWATSAIPVDGYNNRIYLVFRDGGGRLIGATAIPVCTTGQTNCSN